MSKELLEPTSDLRKLRKTVAVHVDVSGNEAL
jgi:hypothetical protein